MMNDLISRQATLIETLESALLKHKDGSFILCSPEFVSVAVEILKELKTLRWIPCSERLPEEENVYLVTFDKSCLLDNEIQVTNALWIDNQWQYDVLESYEHRMPKLVIEPCEELKVTAWMPLPEPYKGEEK